MAQPMMHLLIADKIYTEKFSFIHSYSDFLLGSIAPDAVHVKENYTRELKDISHYRFNSKSRISYFDTFFNEYYTAENKDFVAGYLVHLLSDMIWYHSIRVPFKEEFLKAPSQNMSMNEAYYADCEQIEQLMYLEKSAFRIIEAINRGNAYSLEGLIDAEDVKAWKEKFIFDYNNKNNHLRHTKYISEQHIRDYIENCARECAEYLRYLPYFQG
ncbi:MAG: zinc dependent phospholipase C family protein [Lachnospiraceae bacterium]|nr:zinc dependent phospholipase C family protein [Lachnospiraceae bacterium]